MTAPSPRRALVALALTSALVLAVPHPPRVEAGSVPRAGAPLVGTGAPPASPGAYVVVLRADAGAARAAMATAAAVHEGAVVTHTYRSALHGFSARLSAASLRALRADPAVAYVEVDHAVTIQGEPVREESPVTWGLDRIDQRRLPLDDRYARARTGADVTAYVIDTGIRLTHRELVGRAVGGFDAVDPAGGALDCNGHGTHVAGTIGGSTLGVAGGVHLVAVRVLDCTGRGSDSSVIAGVDWITSHHAAGQPAVANMSVGGSASAALDAAVTASIRSGVTYAVAAGNGDGLGNAVDACSGSPARVPEALTVSATDRSDARAAWADTGRCVDLFAPGVDITSSWDTGDTATNTISGTSMATPEVTGAAALWLQDHPHATPAEVAAGVVGSSTPDVVRDAGADTPNRLLYVGAPTP